MAKPKSLKVFRTPIGFHDAYVAAPTKKAALEAWGSSRNLFTLGQAEEVVDPALTQAPLARPGIVIRVSRGTVAEQLQALPPNEASPKPPVRSKKAGPPPQSPVKADPLPRPKRDAVDALEAALAAQIAVQGAKLADIEREIDALAQKRAVLVDSHAVANATAQAALDRARNDYDKQLLQWRNEG